MAIAMVMAMRMYLVRPPFAVSTMYVVEILVVLRHTNHCKMEAVIMMAALEMERLWRGVGPQGLGRWQFP